MGKSKRKKTYIAYSDFGDEGKIIILAEAESMKELMKMIEDGELSASNTDDVKIGYYEE